MALAAVKGNAQNPVLASCVSIHQCGVLLESGFESLRAGFSSENYPMMKRSMQAIEMAKRKEWVEKFNRTSNITVP